MNLFSFFGRSKSIWWVTYQMSHTSYSLGNNFLVCNIGSMQYLWLKSALNCLCITYIDLLILPPHTHTQLCTSITTHTCSWGFLIISGGSFFLKPLNIMSAQIKLCNCHQIGHWFSVATGFPRLLAPPLKLLKICQPNERKMVDHAQWSLQ